MAPELIRSPSGVPLCSFLVVFRRWVRRDCQRCPCPALMDGMRELFCSAVIVRPAFVWIGAAPAT
jgi:hypothetical protein